MRETLTRVGPRVAIAAIDKALDHQKLIPASSIVGSLLAVEDLPVLIDTIFKKLHTNSRLAVSLRFDTAALRLLSDYSWPGNVRELENVIERLANNTMETGVVSAADVRSDLKHNGWSEHDDEPREIILSKGLKCLNEGSVAVRHLSRRDELELYLKALDESEGDLSKAARRLGIKRTTLYMRIKRMQHNLDRDAIT